MKISFECSELIKELKADIAEFGGGCPCWAVFVTYNFKNPITKKDIKKDILVNYLIDEEKPTIEEMENGKTQLTTLSEILKMFEEQNKII